MINAYIPSEEYGSWSLKEVYSDDNMFFDLNTENADFKQWMDNMNMAFGKKVNDNSNSEDTKDDTDSGFKNKKIDGNNLMKCSEILQERP